MKRLLLGFSFLISGIVSAQQIGNSNLESWDNLGSNQEEPTNWNGFKSATGSFSGFGSQQIERSSSIRAGASGTYCARIWSKSTLGVMANGVMTSGRMNMGSSSLSSASNYNFSQIDDANFSEALTTAPDSLVFWAKYTAASSEQAGAHAVIHDQYAAHDPVDAATQPYVVADADINYSPTNGAWKRFSVPFVYTVTTGLSPKFILLTFSTNHIPGGGAANDEVLIDDVQLIYNSVSSIDEVNSPISVSVSDLEGLQLSGLAPSTQIHIYETSGQLVQEGSAAKLEGSHLKTGFYLVQIEQKSFKIYVP
ncbi:MAG: hypothetical protein RLZZ301_316 [Bacteroidota bacterium]|jgi:hypothetical protein